MAVGKSSNMTQDEARAFALSLPDTTEQSHMGRPDLRVRKRIFLTLPPEGRTVNLKSSRENLAALVARDPEAYRDVWGGRWMGVTLEGVEAEVLRALIVDAWRLAAPRALARAHSSILGA